MEVIVEYDYAAQNVDELNIRKGERIRNVVRKEDGWFEGELIHNGKRGLFPDNFVKPVPTISKVSTPLANKQLNGTPIMGNNINTNPLVHNSQNLQSKTPDDKKKPLISNGTTLPTGKQPQIPHHPPTSQNLNNYQQQLQQQPIRSTSPIIAPTSHSQTPVSNSYASPQPPPIPKPKNKQNNEFFNARVLYSYVPINEDELAIQENEIVKVIRLVLMNSKKLIFNEFILV
jgi:hypothetical protein